MPKTVSRFVGIDEELSAIAPRGKCTLCHWLEQQPDIDRAFLTDLMRLPVEVKSHRYVADLIAADGPELSTDVVSRHRQKHLARG